ncbi:hypothetical protein NB688_002552 [Xanthomonas sacchari]|uniref:Secreted protein n=1 Tax=Xanthomonas sacchari TaxID=56458 RepID=A0ABT3DUG1_9XANT|nr:hypothetical protein [Xanthomonas sacchari]MCW0399150.1 hypothetical protein [Xanthomonas sacchari]MCW0420386.1 hypothetical protein [Xanthomonas sacchari]UYK74648.1 hypothetical protein NG828_10190 [Xanthomonas sacchari]
MEMKKTSSLVRIALASVLLAGAQVAQACCPDGGHGAPAAAAGLGEALPKARNLALDPAWRIYEFQRDGVTYLQINDVAGTVRAAVGRVNDTLWVLPMGADVARVTLPVKGASATGAVVYQTSGFVVRVVPGSGGNTWQISAAD